MMEDPASWKAQTRLRFNKAAANFDSGSGCFAHYGRRLVEAADVKPRESILDIACGRGAVLIPAAKRVGPRGEAIGVDLAEEMVRAAEEETRKQGVRAQLRVMDAETLEFDDERFDAALCGFGVMFFPDRDRALSEFWRVLKPMGRLALSTWRLTQSHELEAVFAEHGLSAPRPGWISEASELESVFNRAGFKEVSIREDPLVLRFADAADYWNRAMGSALRSRIEQLSPAPVRALRATLAKRLALHQQPDGIAVEAIALIGVARR